MLSGLVVFALLLPSVFGSVVPGEHIRVSLSRKARNQALGRKPKLLVSASANNSSGLCSNLQTSANATECAGFTPVDNGAYFGQVSLGTDPVQTFNVTLDSGSSDLWIYSTNGSSVQKNIWVPTASKSGSDTGKSSSISYGDGSQEFYEWWSETVAFGGLTATGVMAGAADITENNVTASDVLPQGSGLLGIGWPALNTAGFAPFIQVAYQQHLIKDQLYGFYAGSEDNSTNGELTLGAVDSSRYTGTLNYHNMTADNGTYNFFNVNVTKLTIQGQTKDYTNGKALNMIVDTGTSFLVLPDNVVDALIKTVNGTLISNSTVSGGYSVPCDQLAHAPSITFEIDNLNYTIPGNVWTHRDNTLAEAGVPCFAELYNGGDTGFDGLFGDTFFRQYYTVFDFANERVGFALSVTASNFTANVTSSGSGSGKSGAATKNVPLTGSVAVLALMLLAYLTV